MNYLKPNHLSQYLLSSLGGVFDGHGGWQVSNFIAKYLISELNNQFSNYRDQDHHVDISTLEEIDLNNILINTFQNTEDEIIKRVKSAFQLGTYL